MSNSCFNGNIHTTGFSSSEEYIIAQDKGAIAYIASVSLGVPSDLHQYSNAWISNMAGSLYGKPIGKIIQQSIEDIQIVNNQRIKNICQYMTLHGDPAMIINSKSKPDFSVSALTVYSEPSIVTSDLDSFTLNVIVTNTGMAINDSMFVELNSGVTI